MFAKLYTVEENSFYLKEEVTSLTNRKVLKSRSDVHKPGKPDPWLGPSLSWWDVSIGKSSHFIGSSSWSLRFDAI